MNEELLQSLNLLAQALQQRSNPPAWWQLRRRFLLHRRYLHLRKTIARQAIEQGYTPETTRKLVREYLYQYLSGSTERG